jgi:hypothetical protein
VVLFRAQPRLLLAIVPNVGGELPVVPDLLPDHDVLPRDLLRIRALRLKLNAPISRADPGPSGFTSMVAHAPFGAEAGYGSARCQLRAASLERYRSIIASVLAVDEACSLNSRLSQASRS